MKAEQVSMGILTHCLPESVQYKVSVFLSIVMYSGFSTRL